MADGGRKRITKEEREEQRARIACAREAMTSEVREDLEAFAWHLKDKLDECEAQITELESL